MPLHPTLQLLLDRHKAAETALQDELTPTKLRELSRAHSQELCALAGFRGPYIELVTDFTISTSAYDLPIRLYHPLPGQELPVIVWFHGGGFVTGDLDAGDPNCRNLAAAGGCMVVAVDYRLAPENRFPAAFDDAYVAVTWVAENCLKLGADLRWLAVGGTSAGGNLAAAVCIAARDRAGPQISHQFLVCPVLDATMSSETYLTYGAGYNLTTQKMRWFWDQYLNKGIDPRNPYVSPLLADQLSGLPAADIITSEFDPLRGEAEAYAARLLEAGVTVTATSYPGMMHGIIGFPVVSARAALDQIGAALRNLAGCRA